MIETRTPEAVLHVKMCPNPKRPCRPDVQFTIAPDDPGLPQSIPVILPYDDARALASRLQTEFIALETIRGQDAQEGPRAPLWARLCRWVQRWAR